MAIWCDVEPDPGAPTAEHNRVTCAAHAFVRSPFLLVGGGTPVLASLLNSYGRLLVEAASTMTAAELHNSWLTYFRGVFC